MLLGTYELGELALACLSQPAVLDQVCALVLHLLYVGSLFFEGLVTQALKVLLVLRVDIEAAGHGHPLGLVHKLVRCAAAFLLIRDNPVVDVHIVDPQCALLGQGLRIQVFSLYGSVIFEPLWPRLGRRIVVLSLEALVALHRVLQLKLHL